MAMGQDCWEKARVSLGNLWIGVASRLGVRKSGLLKLRRDVRKCEYDDVHIMWEMLKNNNNKTDESPPISPKTTKKRSVYNLFNWARCAPYFSR